LCVTWKQDLGVARTTADTMKAPPSPDCSACSWYTATPFTCRKLAQRRFSPGCVDILCANMLGCSSAYQQKFEARVYCPHYSCMVHLGRLSQLGSCRLVQSFCESCSAALLHVASTTLQLALLACCCIAHSAEAAYLLPWVRHLMMTVQQANTWHAELVCVEKSL